MFTALPDSGFNSLAILISFALLLLFIPVVFYVEIAWNKAEVNVGIPAMGPIVVLLLLTGAMSLPVVRRIGLTRREVLVVYIVLLVAGPVFSYSVMLWMLSKTIAYFYMGQADLSWQNIFLKSKLTKHTDTNRRRA